MLWAIVFTSAVSAALIAGSTQIASGWLSAVQFGLGIYYAAVAGSLAWAFARE